MMLKSRYSTVTPEIPSADRTPTAFVRYLDPASVDHQTLQRLALPWLCDQEQARLTKITTPSLAHAYLVAHALKRDFLAQMVGCTPKELGFTTADRGKPFISAPASATGWHFNLSHTQSLVAIAASADPIGIDVEALSRRVPDVAIAKRYFSAREYEHLATVAPSDQAHLFLRYWTLKEAFLKAEGWGLSQRLDAVEFDLSGDIRLTVLDPAAQPAVIWRFWQQPIASHLIAVALASTSADSETSVDCQPWASDDWQLTASRHYG